jgi:hypothetical protein
MGRALELLERAYGIMDSGDGDRLAAEFDGLFAPTFELGTPIVTRVGRDAIDWWLSFGRAFPDQAHRVVASAEAGDLVAVEGNFSGTNSGPIAMPDGGELPATGRGVSLGYAHIARLEGGRFSSWHVYFDTAAFMTQLGLVPEPASA